MLFHPYSTFYYDYNDDDDDNNNNISFMQGIYTYIPDTNRVPKQYNVSAILSLLFMVPISLVLRWL
jgi:hypothetical protein